MATLTCPTCTHIWDWDKMRDGNPAVCPRCRANYTASPAPSRAQARPAAVVHPIAARSDEPQRVIVVDFRMPFMSMVMLLVEISLASIPALLVLFAMFGGLAWFAMQLMGK